jgi:hypothetical protein
MSKTFHMDERAFLNLHIDLRAYIIAYVEDTSSYSACSDEYREGGQIALKLADCYREIDLNFDLSTEILTRFSEAIEAEVKAIEERATVQQHERAAAAVH